MPTIIMRGQDHGLEIVAYALKLRQSYLLPAGVTPEAQAAQAEAWTAGTAYAALLHDIGKIAVDLHVEHADGSVWHPWHGPLRKPYRFRYRKEREYRLHSAATGLLYVRLLDRDIFARRGYRFEVVDMDGNRVDRILVSRAAPPSGSGSTSAPPTDPTHDLGP
jgi:integrating conjugative element relaxase (TIGR03760 family)